MSNNKVNTMIIGTQKAGTTSLYHYIKQHPEICFSTIKEITYFVDTEFYQRGEEYLHSFFPKDPKTKIIASSFVHMLPDAEAPSRVYNYNPDMKIVVCLRDPVTRANSAFHYAIKNGWETEHSNLIDTMNRKLDQSTMDILRYHDLNYFENGLYYKHIQTWLKKFPKAQLFLVRDEDLRSNTQGVLKDLYAFLGVDSSFEVDTSVEYNKASVVKSQALQNFLKSKNSFVKKIFATIFPSKVKIWLRSKLVAKVEDLNKIQVVNPGIPDEEKLRMYFQEDLKALEAEFGVKL